MNRAQIPPEPSPEAPIDTLWQRLRATALVGTARKALPEGTGLVPDTGSEPPLALLDHAAAALVQRRAGMVPRAATPVPPATPDPRPPAPAAAARRLHRILDGPRQRGLLAEWLQLAAEHGYRLPAETLPQLLSDSTTPHYRESIARLAGPRERWYVAQRDLSAWRFLLEDAPDSGAVPIDAESWPAHVPAERRGALAALRRRDPAAARELLAAVWRGERAEERRSLLAVLGEGLGAADEEFLEGALGDRSAGVRGQALRLLSHLSDSAHAARLRERATGALTWSTAGAEIEVSLPDLSDTALQRDLALAKPDTSAPVDTAWHWLAALLAAVPLDFWTRRLATDAEGLIAAVVGAENWRLLAVFTEAVNTQQDAEWATALYPWLTDSRNADRVPAGRTERGASLEGSVLRAAVPHELRCQAALQMLTDPQSPRYLPSDNAFSERLGWSAMRDRVNRLHEAVRHVEGPWTSALGDCVLGLLRTADADSPYRDLLSHIIELAGQRLALSLRPTMTPPPGSDPDDTVLAAVTATLDFRLEMHKEFR